MRWAWWPIKSWLRCYGAGMCCISPSKLSLLLTRDWLGYFYNTTGLGGGIFLVTPLRSRELMGRLTKFKLHSKDLINLLMEAQCCWPRGNRLCLRSGENQHVWRFTKFDFFANNNQIKSNKNKVNKSTWIVCGTLLRTILSLGWGHAMFKSSTITSKNVTKKRVWLV